MLPAAANAGDIYWQPVSGNDWSNPSNWSPYGLPDATSTVHIDSSYATLGSLTGSTTISALQNNGSATLQVNSGGTLTITNGITASSTANQSLNLRVNDLGTVYLGGTTSLPVNLQFVSSGTLEFQSGASATIGTLDVSGGTDQGHVNIDNGASVTVHSLGVSTGGFVTATATGTLTVDQNFGISGLRLQNNATVSLTGTEDLGTYYAGQPELYGGTLGGSGDVAGYGTIKLGSDVLIEGDILSGSSVNNPLTLQSVSSSAINLQGIGGTFIESSSGNDLTLKGSMNIWGEEINGAGAPVVLNGTFNFPVSANWDGNIVIANGSVVNVTGGIASGLNIGPYVDLLGNASLTVSNGPDFGLEGGTYNVGANATLTLNSARIAGAIINTSGNFDVPNGYSADQGTTDVNGTMDAGSNDVTVSNGAMLQGDGTIDAANVNVDGSTIKPGNSPGTLTINGNLNLDSASTTKIQFQGTTPGSEFDVLQVNGNLNLNGFLETQLLKGFIPTENVPFDFLNYTGDLTGTFSGWYDYIGPDEHWVIDYSHANATGGGFIDLIAEAGAPNSPAPSTPEPASWLLLAGGVAAITGWKRRELPQV